MLSPATVIGSDPATFFSLVVCALVIGLAVLVIKYLRRTSRLGVSAISPDNLVRSSKPVLTEAEARFFCSLEKAVEGQYLVWPQLPLWTFIDVRSNHAGATAAFTNRINLKRVDFTLVDRRTFTVWKAIELDDRTHQRLDRQRRDAFVETVLKQAGVQLVRIPAARAYDTQAIRRQLGMNGTDVNDRTLAEAL
ncbi:MAG: DUF2726 domain-containing protein [Nitrospirota bacterium]|nr:DUF2726 domain-containing protein [Nitrospirota bacterium]